MSFQGRRDDGSPAVGRERYQLRLFVTGTSQRSMRAIENVRRICQQRLEGRYDLEVVDLYQSPEAVIADQIVAAPTLLKLRPPPVRRIVGDMADERRVLAGLGLPADAGSIGSAPPRGWTGDLP